MMVTREKFYAMAQAGLPFHATATEIRLFVEQLGTALGMEDQIAEVQGAVIRARLPRLSVKERERGGWDLYAGPIAWALGLKGGDFPALLVSAQGIFRQGPDLNVTVTMHGGDHGQPTEVRALDALRDNGDDVEVVEAILNALAGHETTVGGGAQPIMTIGPAVKAEG